MMGALYPLLAQTASIWARIVAMSHGRFRRVVVFQWAWSFLSYDRGARLITGPIYRAPDQARRNGRPAFFVARRSRNRRAC